MKLEPAVYTEKEELRKKQEENIITRVKILKELEYKQFQDLIKEKCKEDFHYWLKYFCCTFDPRPEAAPGHLPFIPYNFQDILSSEIITSIKSGQDVLIEKSRDMGASWLILYIFQWFWQFHQSSGNFLIGSKKADNVDVIGDISSLFGKLRYNIQKQPSCLLPDRFSIEKHSGYMKLINPTSGNSITGESSNANFSRSGRYTAILFDELAFWETGSLSWGSAGDSSPCRIALSTPFGKANQFGFLRWDPNTKIKILSTPWYLHPLKTKNLQKVDGKYTSDWYEYQKTRKTPAEMGREIDIDYMTSREGAVYKFNPKVHVVKDLKQEILKTVDKPKIVRTWDFGLNPAVIYSYVSDYGLRILKELVPSDKPTTANLVALATNVSNTDFPGCYFVDLCDIAGNQTNRQTKKTDIEILNAAGIYPVSNKVPIEDGITLVQNLLDRSSGLEIDMECVNIIDAFLGGYYRKEDKTGLNKEMSPEQIHPFEDVMDCVRYTVWEYFKPKHPDQDVNKKKYEEKASNMVVRF